MDQFARPFFSLPSGIASISVGGVGFVSLSGEDSPLRVYLTETPLFSELSAMSAALFLSFFVGLYVSGTTVLILCNAIRRHYDPNDKKRYRYVLSKANDREFSEWLGIELKSQIVFATILILVFGIIQRVSIVAQGYGPDAFQSRMLEFAFPWAVMGGFIAFIRKLSPSLFRRFDKAIALENFET